MTKKIDNAGFRDDGGCGGGRTAAESAANDFDGRRGRRDIGRA